MKTTARGKSCSCKRSLLCGGNETALSLHNYKRSARIMKELRAIKSPFEVEAIQKAIDITDNTFSGTVISLSKPRLYTEYEIERGNLSPVFSNVPLGNGSTAGIIASGDRARTLHYVENNSECKNGELILMDFCRVWYTIVLT